jgi:hypothetical protein
MTPRLEIGLVRLDRNTCHARSKSARASSKVAAVAELNSPGCEPG